MANNRMYLKHTPSGLELMLGKRMRRGYYYAPEKAKLEEFFDTCEQLSDELDSFVLEYEDEPETEQDA